MLSQAIERLVEKAVAQQHKARPSDVIYILCGKPEDVPARVDVLIADGKLSEADRPRCVFCDDGTFVAMTHDQRVVVWAINETEADRRRIIAESAAHAKADLAEFIAAAENAKSESADRL